ncbi:hypothetical protein KUCAC02_020527 [Chaenocephalus aceratus]|nr:hypothetical protein KUCAC02_020527 [Chaenocephalus aceratus]
MVVPKSSQDSELKIKLAVRMDKPPNMKHSGRSEAASEGPGEDVFCVGLLNACSELSVCRRTNGLTSVRPAEPHVDPRVTLSSASWPSFCLQP